MTRHLSTLLILAFFLLMMSLLTKDHILPMLEYGDSAVVSGAQLAESWGGTDEWMTLSFNGKQIGGMRQAVTKLPDGFAATGKTLIRAGFVGGTLETAATMNERLELQQVRLVLRLGNGQEIELAGMVERLTLYLRLKSGTGVRYTQIPLRQVPTLNISSDALFAGRMMQKGESYLMDVYDPLWGMQAGKMRVSLVGTEEIETEQGVVEVKVAEAKMQNIRMRIWLDDVEMPLRREVSYSPGTSNGQARLEPMKPSFVLRMDRMSEAEKRTPFFETLYVEPEPPDLARDELRGENEGEPLEAFGLLPLLFKSQFESLARNTNFKGDE